MDFLVELFRNLLEHADSPMSQAFSDSYSKTLQKWHGWLAGSVFTVAMKLSPDRKKFMDVICGTGDINSDIEKFCTSFSLLLEENHKFLVGMSIDPKLLLSNFLVIMGSLGVLIGGKTLLVALVGKLFGISIVSAIRVGLLLAPMESLPL